MFIDSIDQIRHNLHDILWKSRFSKVQVNVIPWNNNFVECGSEFKYIWKINLENSFLTLVAGKLSIRNKKTLL